MQTHPPIPEAKRYFHTLFVRFMAIWLFLRPFEIFFPVLVHFAEKNLATSVARSVNPPLTSSQE
jgi:hypothetical protein